MDSLTQLTLGAAVGEAILGQKVGRKAALWGAVCGTLPDLDILVPFADPVKQLTYHRSFSHSIIVLSLVTPLVVWLILKIHSRNKQDRTGWCWLVWLCFITHVLLDCLTVFGTQIFWPFWTYPVGLGSIFIIDPFYTLPLLFGILCALVMKRSSQCVHRINQVTLALSTLYLVWSIAAHSYVIAAARDSLARQSVHCDKMMVTAGPFNTLLWRIVAMQADGGYVEGFYSLADGHHNVTLTRHKSSQHLLLPLSDHWPVQRLQWFTKGFYKVSQAGQEVVITDLRMGAEPSYVFSFVVGTTIQATPARQLEPTRDFSLLKKAWRRIWATKI